MKHYLYFSFLLICISINAQNNNPVQESDKDSIFTTKLTGELFFDNIQYIGEMYYNKNWVKSDILLSTGSMVYGEKIKYNGFFDEVIWLNSSNFGKYKLDKSFITDFWLKSATDQTIHFKRIHVGDTPVLNQSDIFVQVVIEGKMSIYIQRKISVIGEENIYIDNRLCYFNDVGETPLYFIRLATNHYLKMNRINRRTFLKLFPDQKKEIVKLLKDNHLSFKTESDFIKVIDLMNKKDIM